MAKPQYRKMLPDWDVPYIQSLAKLIPTQSKTTLATWTVSYAEEHLLPLWEKHYPDDGRPKNTLLAAREMINSKIKWNGGLNPKVQDCLTAAKETDSNIVARTAARAIAQCSSTIHSGSHSIGMAQYGALAIAYDKLGIDAPWEQLLQCAALACGSMEAALREIAVENEPNPAKITWEC